MRPACSRAWPGRSRSSAARNRLPAPPGTSGTSGKGFRTREHNCLPVAMRSQREVTQLPMMPSTRGYPVEAKLKVMATRNSRSTEYGVRSTEYDAEQEGQQGSMARRDGSMGRRRAAERRVAGKSPSRVSSCHARWWPTRRMAEWPWWPSGRARGVRGHRLAPSNGTGARTEAEWAGADAWKVLGAV